MDEPDTHLNPIWKWQYLEFLDNVVKRPETTQIIINTHDPLVIGSLKKEEVRIFRRDTVSGKTIVEAPEFDPRGLGVDGILTSDLFGLSSTLDENTQAKLELRNKLLVKQQTEEFTLEDMEQLQSLHSELEKLGFSNTFRDPIYQKFIIAYKKVFSENHKKSYSREELDYQNQVALEILAEIMKEEEK